MMSTDFDSETNAESATPGSARHPILFGTAASILFVGFCLGFFPALLAEGGSLGRAVELGAYAMIALVVAIVVGAVAHGMLQRVQAPPMVQSIVTLSIAMGTLYAFGRFLSGEGGSWTSNLLSGLGNGAIIGAAVGWFQHRKRSRAAPGG